jgi:uncharacterized protein
LISGFRLNALSSFCGPAHYVEDPSLLGSRGVIPRPEFKERRHDYEGKPPFDKTDRAYRAMGIFIEGAKPAPPPAFAHVD